MAALSETTPGGHLGPTPVPASEADTEVSEAESLIDPAPKATGQGVDPEELRQQLISYYLSTGSNVPPWVEKG